MTTFDFLQNLDNDIRLKENPIHVSFVRIHPFWDGNGRIARLIANVPEKSKNHFFVIPAKAGHVVKL